MRTWRLPLHLDAWKCWFENIVCLLGRKNTTLFEVFRLSHNMFFFCSVGSHCGSFCKDDTCRFKENSSSSILPFMGCFFAAPEVEWFYGFTYLSNHVFFFLCSLIWFLLLLQLNWLNLELAKIWPYVNEVNKTCNFIILNAWS